MKKAILVIAACYAALFVTEHIKAQSQANPNPIYQAPTANSAVVVQACGTAPTDFPQTSGQRAPETVDINGNKCGAASISSLPGITYNQFGIPTLTNGQSETDVQIVSNGGVRVATAATSDGIVATVAVSTSSVTDGKWAISTVPANIYGYQIGSPASTVCYLQLYNKAPGSITPGTTVPDMFIQVAGATTGGFPSVLISPTPIANYGTAVTALFMTTATGATKCGSGATATIFIK